MIPFPNFFPAIGGASTATDLANHLGNLLVMPNGKAYRLVKAAEDIALAAGKGLKVGYTAGVPNWTVTHPSAVTTQDVVFVPSGQVGTGATSTTLVSGDYFLAQVAGAASLLAGNTTLVGAENQVLVVNTTGYVASYVSSTAYEPGSCVRATNTAGASAAGVSITGYIAGLI